MQINDLIRPLFYGVLLIWLAIGSAFAGETEEAQNPVMGASLSFPEKPNILEVPHLGAIKVSAVGTILGMSQSNPTDGNPDNLVDLSNAQLILQKDTGLFQFYIQAGYYSIPSLGTSYQRANRQTIDSFGLFPLANISVPVGGGLKISAGKLNSFGGYESTYSFQNINIDRGLLWNQTSNVSKGFQATYTADAFTTAITLNDGFYSNQLSWMGASVAYQFNPENSASMSWTGAIKSSTTSTFTTPVTQNNSQIFNAIYTYNSGRLMVTPYLQYTYVPANPAIGILSSGQTAGAAVLLNYRFFSVDSERWSLPIRVEYIGSSGKGDPNAPNFLYGVGSSAWSATITPTLQVGKYFARAEYSYVQAINVTPGYGFGSSNNMTNQSRIMIETGLLF